MEEKEIERKIVIDKMKQQLEDKMKDSRSFPGTYLEDLHMLKVQVMGLADTFELITQEEAWELISPMQKEITRLEEK